MMYLEYRNNYVEEIFVTLPSTSYITFEYEGKPTGPNPLRRQDWPYFIWQSLIWSTDFGPRTFKTNKQVPQVYLSSLENFLRKFVGLPKIKRYKVVNN